MNGATKTRELVEETWTRSILPALTEYIRIPCKSPDFDSDWKRAGYLDQAVRLLEEWCRTQSVPGMRVRVLRLENRTPLLCLEVPGEGDGSVLLYGHFDKQPEMTGWSDGLGPWEPVRKAEKLYGRGGADDGYAVFAAVTAIRAVRERGGSHPRCIVLIEGSEESGSTDRPAYVDHLAGEIGRPDLVLCLDSGCANYDQLWCTTSLRGNLIGELSVDILTEGVHSGEASGVVPSSFRILRQLLSRLEDAETGEILPPELYSPLPPEAAPQAQALAASLGGAILDAYPWVEGARPVSGDPVQLLLNRTWRPTLSITGVGGMPSIADAGNVLRPRTAVKLSFRLAPGADAGAATAAVKQLVETDPPYGAKVSFRAEMGGEGWVAPPLPPWLQSSVDRASREYFGKEPGFIGEGGSIPFMSFLGKRFPEAQFLVVGVLGPHSNAHGPNEFLHLPMAQKLTCCISEILQDHPRQR
jgi:acetylornithine deacetylase/succinyl-diaminopimelate desuccinylase-like protein